MALHTMGGNRQINSGPRFRKEGDLGEVGGRGRVEGQWETRGSRFDWASRTCDKKSDLKRGRQEQRSRDTLFGTNETDGMRLTGEGTT